MKTKTNPKKIIAFILILFNFNIVNAAVFNYNTASFSSNSFNN